MAVGSSPRRVPGLRREEVAILAGISTEYYLRLEQGRDVNPSRQVLDALARALKLDAAATAYLHGLTRPTGPPVPIDRGDVVSERTRLLIDSWPHTAAIVHSRYLDVLASNALARALNPNYSVGTNSVLTLVTDPWEQTFHRDWEALAARSVALLRTIADTKLGDARLDALVAEGSASSALFRKFWESRDVVRVSEGVHPLNHPLVGELVLNYQRLPLVGTDGQSLFLYFATPETHSAASLARLVSPGWDQWGQEGSPLRV